MSPTHANILARLKGQRDKIASAAETQRKVGNEDTALYFDEQVHHADLVLKETAEYMYKYQDATEGDILKWMKHKFGL